MTDLIDRLRDNLVVVMAAVLIVAILIGYSLFTVKSIMPQWQMRGELLPQVALAEAELAQAGRSNETSADALLAQLDSAPTRLALAAAPLYSIEQADLMVNRLYAQADASEVAIAELQTQNLRSATDGLFQVDQLQVRITGKIEQLLDFLAGLNETAHPGLLLNNVSMNRGELSDTLTMTVVLYSSPHAPGVTLVDVESPADAIVVPPIEDNVIPVDDGAAPVEGSSAPVPTATYVVQRGDTLLSVARQYNVTLAAIKQANDLRLNTVEAGQVLLIP